MKKILTIIILAAMSMSAAAIPANPRWIKELQQKGDTATLRKIQIRELQLQAMYREAQRAKGLVQNEDGAYAPTRTTTHEVNVAQHGLIILVNFADLAWQPENTLAEMDSMMNGMNYVRNYTYRESGRTYTIHAEGSARQYFHDTSDGQYNPHFTVVGPYTLSKGYAYYGGNGTYWGQEQQDINAQEMIAEACELADPDVDFSQFDNDGDGIVDYVYVFYAGPNESDGAGDDYIWPHSYHLSYAWKHPRFDGVRIDLYATSGEIDGTSGKHDGIGTFCHEFSHVIGLPDLYDTEYGTNYYQSLTPGDWSLMDSGPYSNNGNTPPLYAPWDRYVCGWVTPTVLYQPQDLEIAPGEVYLINGTSLRNQPDYEGEVYYLENRRKTGWDAYLPGEGLVVWKVNYNRSAWEGNYVNNDEVLYSVLGKKAYPSTTNTTDVTPMEGFPLSRITQMPNGNICLQFRGGDGSLFDPCEGYTWTAKTNLVQGENYLSGHAWNLNMSRGMTSSANIITGVQFVPKTDTASVVTLTTIDSEGCAPTTITVKAKGQGATMIVMIGDQILATQTLTNQNIDYAITNPNGYEGEISIQFTPAGTTAISIKSLQVSYDELTPVEETTVKRNVESVKSIVDGRLVIKRGDKYYDINGRSIVQ